MVVSGRVVSVENKTEANLVPSVHVTIEYDCYDPQTRTSEIKQMVAVAPYADELVAVGSYATAVGYQSSANSMTAQKITAKNSIISFEDVDVVSGMISRATFKPEVDETGAPLLTSKGLPRAPHFDITIPVLDEEGHKVHHKVKIYNYKTLKPGQSPEIERAKKAFNGFTTKDETPTYVTIMTNAGSLSTWTSEFNGTEYQNYGCDHLGKRFLDVNKLNVASADANPQPSTAVPTAVGDDEDVFVQ